MAIAAAGAASLAMAMAMAMAIFEVHASMLNLRANIEVHAVCCRAQNLGLL